MGSKVSIAMAFALAIASTAPASASMNGTDYQNYLRAARSNQSNLQTQPWVIERQQARSSAQPACPRLRSAVKPYPRRYDGVTIR